jgi:hypothetical protein
MPALRGRSPDAPAFEHAAKEPTNALAVATRVRASMVPACDCDAMVMSEDGTTRADAVAFGERRILP